MIFRKGVYTACEPCRDNPGKPPLWQIKAARIIHDQAEQTVYYEDARFEFFGVPIAYLPVFFHPDPTVKRKTGFLTPSFMGSRAIGYGVTTPFFWNLAPNYDVTFSPTISHPPGPAHADRVAAAADERRLRDPPRRHLPGGQGRFRRR